MRIIPKHQQPIVNETIVETANYDFDRSILFSKSIINKYINDAVNKLDFDVSSKLQILRDKYLCQSPPTFSTADSISEVVNSLMTINGVINSGFIATDFSTVVTDNVPILHVTVIPTNKILRSLIEHDVRKAVSELMPKDINYKLEILP